MLRRIVVVLLAFVFLGGCGAAETDRREMLREKLGAKQQGLLLSGLDVRVRGEREFAGTYGDEAGEVLFEAMMTTERRIDATVWANATELRYTFDATAGTAEENFVEWQVVGGYLSNEHIPLLEGFHRALVEVVPVPPDTDTPDENLPHEIALRDFTGMITESPEETPLEGVRFSIAQLNEFTVDDGPVVVAWASCPTGATGTMG